MLYSVITLCCNRLEYTTQSVNSVCANAGTRDYEHIVVNQASSDGTREWLDYVSSMPFDWFGKIKPIHTDTNLGYWKGFGVGYDAAQGDYLVFMDNDIVVETPNFLDTMREALESTNFDIVQAQSREAYYTRPDRRIGGTVGRNDHIEYPVAFFMMHRRHFIRDLKLCDCYKHHKNSFSTDKVMCYGLDSNLPDRKPALNKIKYPAYYVYDNLKGNCPMGNAPWRLPGQESEYFRTS